MWTVTASRRSSTAAPRSTTTEACSTRPLLISRSSADPGASARLGHGDAMHVTDIDPDRPGLEIFTVHEGATSAPYGMAMRAAEIDL